ncbi:hypothetical protein Goari_004539 [Gossypium aridum]|uniref:Flowering-promoting factor 1-like protein 2 n=16 Tax=Gossypium TaxID=3633 RepID=A0A7J8Y3R7_GOSAI|nr:hypothetical protein [Gossypium aridum]
MSGVWVFNNGVYRLESSPKRRVLVHLPSGEAVSSYSSLENILRGLGWERYYGGDPDFYQYHKHSSIDLISLPKDFSKFGSVHMYDIVVKNPNVFHVRDMILAGLSSLRPAIASWYNKVDWLVSVLCMYLWLALFDVRMYIFAIFNNNEVMELTAV